MTSPRFPEPAGSRQLAGSTDEGAGSGEPDAAPSGRTAAHRWGFGAFFLAEGVFVLVSVVLSAIFGKPSASGSWFGPVLVLMLMLPTVLAGTVAVVITLVRGNGPRLDFGLHWRRSDVTRGLSIGGAGLVVTVIASKLWTEWAGPEGSAVSSLLNGVHLAPVPAVVIFLHMWLVAPFCEELLYRGLLWGAMERLRWGQLAILVLSTAVFAIGHLEPDRTLLLLVIAIPIGVARMITGTLTASVIAHQVNNFFPALLLLLSSLGLYSV